MLSGAASKGKKKFRKVIPFHLTRGGEMVIYIHTLIIIVKKTLHSNYSFCRKKRKPWLLTTGGGDCTWFTTERAELLANLWRTVSIGLKSRACRRMRQARGFVLDLLAVICGSVARRFEKNILREKKIACPKKQFVRKLRRKEKGTWFSFGRYWQYSYYIGSYFICTLI